MPRIAAREAIALPSPGRSRMVIRSRAASRAAVAADVRARLSRPSRTVRMAFRASAASDNPETAASVAKRAFSSGDGRAVIERGVGFSE